MGITCELARTVRLAVIAQEPRARLCLSIASHCQSWDKGDANVYKRTSLTGCKAETNEREYQQYLNYHYQQSIPSNHLT